LPAGTSRLDGVEEADELLMAVALHVAADDGAVEHVERGEQRGRAVALVVMGHGAGAALLHRQAGLGAVERLDLALLVDRQHDGMGRRIDVEADDVASFSAKAGSLESLKVPPAVRRGRAPSRCAAPS
jgi:dihydroxyacetone kinase